MYKVKKAVRYSFLDYSTLSKRRHFLQEELRLNRRLAPSVYLAVVPISFDSVGWRLAGRSKPMEYTLVMRRLPESRMLPALLDCGQLTEQMMQSLAEVLGNFHFHAEPLARGEISRHLEKVGREWNNNLADLAPLVGRFMDGEDLKGLQEFGTDFLVRNTELFLRRAAQKRIREVHGDLHCRTCLLRAGRNSDFRWSGFRCQTRRCDLASEIAFLLMDLEVRGGGGLRAPFLKRYRKIVNDTELSELLPFYECYRALVRGKVEALRRETAEARGRRYFRYALEIACRPLNPSS